MEKALDIIARYGADLDSLVEAGFQLYAGKIDAQELAGRKERLKAILKSNSEDPNVALLIAAASHLDTLIGTDDEDADISVEDPAFLVADELIGMSIAEYIAGKRGLFNFVRYDREKPGIIGVLPPFMDDAVGALVAASMTRLFE